MKYNIHYPPLFGRKCMSLDVTDKQKESPTAKNGNFFEYDNMFRQYTPIVKTPPPKKPPILPPDTSDKRIIDIQNLGKHMSKQFDIEDIQHHLAQNRTDKYGVRNSTVSIQYIDQPIETMGPHSSEILSKITNFGDKFGPLIANIAAMTRHISALLAGVSIACPPLAIGAAIVGAISAITSLITVVTKISAKILEYRERKMVKELRAKILEEQGNKPIQITTKSCSKKILSALSGIGKDSGSLLSKISEVLRTSSSLLATFSFVCPPVAIAVAATGANGAFGSFIGTISGMILGKKTRQEEDEPIIYPENLTNLDPNTQTDQFEQDVEPNTPADSSFSSILNADGT